MIGRIETLGMIQSACWRELERASYERDHEWRCIGLGTVSDAGPELRTVILREVLEHENRLTFFTDARSPKVAQIEARPEASLLAWSRALGWQIRMKARLSVDANGPQVAARWEQLRSTAAAADYLSPWPPGTPMSSMAPQPGERSHFAVVNATVLSIDWLELHPAGNRRALFDAQGMRWLNP
jgi:hypothetical protein